MSAASLASYVIGKLSSSAPLETAGSDMTGRSRSASSTPRLTAVWRVKSIPYEIPAPNTSPFKEDGSLLRLLRAKSMPSLVREGDFTSRSARVSSPTSFLIPGDRYTRSPSPSPLKSSLMNPRSSFDLGEGSDSTGASLITPMNSPRDESPAEHRKLTRSASDGHIWARRKTQLRDVRDEFPAGTLPSVKNLKIKFDRNLEEKPENNTERYGRTVSRKLPNSSSDEGDCPGDNTASQHVTTRRQSRHESLERWETDAVEVARLDLHKPRKSIGELKQRFELTVSSTDGDTHPTTQLCIHQTNSETRVKYTEETSPPRKPITVESQSERKSRHRMKNRDGTTRPRAKSEPNPSAIRRLKYEPSSVSVRKLKMQFEIQATTETDYSKKPVPIHQTSEQLPKTLPKEPSLPPTAVNMLSAQNIVKENERKERRFRSELQERSTQSTQVSIDSKITPSVKKLKKQFEEAVLAQYQGKSVERDDPSRPRTTIKSQLRTPFEGNNDSQESENTKREAGQAPAPQVFSSTLVKDLLRQFETLSPEETTYEGSQKFLFEQVPETTEQKPPDDAKAAEVLWKQDYISNESPFTEVVTHTLAAKTLETESIFKVHEYSFSVDKESTVESKIAEEIHKRSASSSDEIPSTRVTCNITDDAQESNQKIDDDWSKKDQEVKNDSKEPKRLTEEENVQEHEKAEETKVRIHNGQEKQQLEERQRVEDGEKEETERKLKQTKPRECKQKEILQERKNRERISQEKKKEKMETQNMEKEKVKKADEREEEVKPGRERKEKPEETKEKHRENGNEIGESQLTLDIEEWQESEEKVNLHIPSDKKEELVKGKSESIQKAVEAKHERQTEGSEDSNGKKTGVFTDQFASTQGNECTNDQFRNVPLPLEDSHLQSSEHKVGQLIDRFTNLDVDFDKLELGQPQSKEDEERRLSDVAALVGKFAKLNKIRHSSSESDEASEGPTSAGKTKEAASIPTIPANTIPGKVRTLKADELRFFETSNTSEPFIRSQSLRMKKTEPPPFLKRRSGSMREKKSGNTLLPPEDSTNAAKALPRNCRPLRPDELRFFGMGNNNIYTVREVNTSKEEVKENKQESEFKQDFRQASQGNQYQHNGFPGDDQKPSTHYDSDSDSEASILRDCDSCDSDEIQLMDEKIEMDDTFKSPEETEISDCEESLSCEIKEITLMNTGTEELLEPVECDQVGEENFLVVSGKGSTINEEYGLKSMPEKENGYATAVTENDAFIYIREGTILELRSVTENTLQGAKGILSEAKQCRNGSGCHREMYEVSNREIQWTEKVTPRNITDSTTVLEDFNVQIPPLPHVDTYSSGRGEFTEELGTAGQRAAQLKVESQLIQFSENTSQDDHKNTDQLQQVTGYEARDDAAHYIQENEKNNIHDEPQRLYNIPRSVIASSNYEEELVTPEDACEREEEEVSENTSSDADLGLVDEAFLKIEDEIDQETRAVPLSFEIDWLQPDLNKLTGTAERVKAEKQTNTVNITPSFLHNAEDLLCLGGLSDDAINHDEQAMTDSESSLLGRRGRSKEVRGRCLDCSGKDEEQERIEDVYLECFDFSNEQHIALFSLLVAAVTLMITLASNYFSS